MQKKHYNSTLYDCTVVHKREYLKYHLLKYKIFMFFVDLDELQNLNKISKLLSYNKFNLYSLYDKDHFYFYKNNDSIKNNMLRYLKEHNLELPDKIFLLTNFRFLGYTFNPVSFYYCFKDGELIYILSEVNNTFSEQKPILIDIKNHTEKKQLLYYHKNKKNFYVSPFVKYDTDLLFRFNIPDEKLIMQVDSGYFNEDRLEYHVKASLAGKKEMLNTKNLILHTIKIPFVTFKIILGIHYHALLLWLKKIPFYKKKNVDEELLQIGERL